MRLAMICALLLTLSTLLTMQPPIPLRAAPIGIAAECLAHRPITPKHSFPEVQGVTSHGSLWALLFYAPPAHSHTDLKIALRMTGSGPLHVVVQGIHGETIHPMWGPEQHGGSNWNRPGDEWGTGWRIPVAGCWSIHATRHGVEGTVWLQVRGHA